MNRIKSILFGIINVGVGCFFVASALLKAFPIENFEIHLAYYGLDITFSTLIARLIIGIELALGILVFSRHRRVVSWSLITLLIAFTLALAWYTLKYPDATDCGCFGKYASVSPIWAIIRNIALLPFLIIIRNSTVLQVRENWNKMLYAIPILFFSAYIIIYPPDIIQSKVVNKLDSPINLKMEKWSVNEDSTEKISSTKYKEGDWLIAYFSTKCTFCIRSASRLDALYQTGKLDPKKSLYVFFGTEEGVGEFYKSANAKHVNYLVLSPEQIIEPTEGLLPTIFLVRDGIPQYKLGYLELTENNLKLLN